MAMPSGKANHSGNDGKRASRTVTVDYDQLSLVSREVQLQDVLLLDAHMSSFPEWRYNDDMDGVSYSFGLSGAVWAFENERLIVQHQYDLAAFADVPEGQVQDKLFELTCGWRILYGVSDTFKPGKAAQMADFVVVNGQLNAFPYVRQFVQDIVGRAGWPPLVLPVYRPPKRRRANLGKRRYSLMSRATTP